MILLQRHLPLVLAGLTGLPLPAAHAESKFTPIVYRINPIARIARIFDPQLVRVEDRVTWLTEKTVTLSKYNEYPLKVGLGYRGGRIRPDDRDPSVTLDLQHEFPIESIFLVPVQREFPQDPGIFPKRFTIEFSNRADFGQRVVLYSTGAVPQTPPAGLPVMFPSENLSARYVRLTVHEGHLKGTTDLFGLSEFVVISNGDPVSFSARVSTEGSLDIPGMWYPQALVDGRTPLGIWQNGAKAPEECGDMVAAKSPKETTTWSIRLEAPKLLQRIVLFPYHESTLLDSSILPESLTIRFEDPDGQLVAPVVEWSNPLPGGSHRTPLVIPLDLPEVTTVQITSTQPWTMGNRSLHAMSEIELWSNGQNVARDLTVTRITAAGSTAVSTLTDGFSSQNRIIPFGVWLSHLNERGRVENELDTLRPVHRQLSSRSELNAAWGSSVVLGLTFLVPVFIVERRRLMSKAQLDQIRKRIASDLHDDIGSNLGSISLIARTARKDLVRLQGPEEIAEDLGEVEMIARESSLAMRDIVWLLERKQDSIGDLVQRMREIANRLLRETSFNLECESNKTAAKLSLDAKRHLFLFYKEAIHNVIKHAQATNVSVRLWDDDDKLALEIRDNGIGISNLDASGKPTVNKLEDRARVLDGHLQITSSKESGTCVRLLVKRSFLTHQSSLS